MSGIDDAAAAFAVEIGGGEAPKTARTIPADTAGDLDITDLFPVRAKEVDDESPEQGGGDDEPTAEEVQARRAKPAQADSDPDDIYADDGDPKDTDDDEGDEEETLEDPDDEGDEETLQAGQEFDLDPELEVTVKVDGEERSVSLGEAMDGYIRTETFHKRMNELDTQRGVIREESQKLLANRKEAITLLSALETDLAALMPEEPDWDTLFAEDAGKARSLQKTFSDYQKRITALRAKRAEQEAELVKESEANIVKFAKEEREKFENLPENRHWKADAAKREKDLAAMVRTGIDLGFTPDEIRGVLDHRMLAVLLRASKYDRMMARRPKAKLPTVGKKLAKPGTGRVTSTKVRTVQRGIGKAQQQLQRTGSVADAAKVMQQLL